MEHIFFFLIVFFFILHLCSPYSFFILIFLHFMPYFPPFWLHPIVHFSCFPVAFSIITSLSPFMSLSHLPPFSCPPLFPSPSHVQFVDRPSEKTETKVDTIVSSPPSLLHLLFCHLLISFFFLFFGLSEVKFPRLFRLLSPLLLQNDTRAKTTASAKAPSNQTNASSEPDDTTKYIKRVDFWMQKKHARACVCVFLTGRMGAPAVCLCDLVKVLLFYFGGTASFSLFLPVTPSLFSSGAARWWWEMRKKWQKLRDVTLSPLAEPLSERVQLA